MRENYAKQSSLLKLDRCTWHVDNRRVSFLVVLMVLGPLLVVLLAGDWIATGAVALLYLVLGLHGARLARRPHIEWETRWNDD